MKKIMTLTLILGFFFIGFSQESVSKKIDLKWEDSFKSALKKSKINKKPVLIYFTGSDWCTPCKILDKKLFHTKKFKDMSDKSFVLYEVDNPRNKDLLTVDKREKNNKLIRKYKIRSYPTLVVVNYKGKMLAYKQGLILTEYYYPFFQSVIENY